MPTKKEWRERLRAAAASVPGPVAAAWAGRLAERVLTLPELTGATTVAGYAATGHELPTSDLLDRLAAAGHRVILPVVLPGGELAWRAYAGMGSLRSGAYGIPEPDADAPAADVGLARVVLVPALGFDEQGCRLGRGGGYYDRLLAVLAPGVLTVGLASDDAVVAELPAEPHDVPVAVVVTPTRTMRIISSRPH